MSDLPCGTDAPGSPSISTTPARISTWWHRCCSESTWGVRAGTSESAVWHGGPMKTRRLAVGCEFTYEAAVRTPAVFQVAPGDSRLVTRRSESWLSTPDLPLRSYRDLYGNPCTRVVLPPGWSTLRYTADVEVFDATEDVDDSAPEIAAEQLPDDTLIYTLPSRYCLPDVLADEAWTLFGARPSGYQRIGAICDHVNSHLTFQYGASNALSTAADVNSSRL